MEWFQNLRGIVEEGSSLDEFEYHHGFGQFGNRGDEVSSFFARKKKNV